MATTTTVLMAFLFLFYLDPHVKVEGKRANVLEAKKKILELLETRVRADILFSQFVLTTKSLLWKNFYILFAYSSNVRNTLKLLGICTNVTTDSMKSR